MLSLVVEVVEKLRPASRGKYSRSRSGVTVHAVFVLLQDYGGGLGWPEEEGADRCQQYRCQDPFDSLPQQVGGDLYQLSLPDALGAVRTEGGAFRQRSAAVGTVVFHKVHPFHSKVA